MTHSFIRRTVTCTSLFLGLMGLGVAAITVVAPMNEASAAESSKLGDLTPFRTIAADTYRITSSGDLVAAKKRIKDLETSWDAAEAGLKPRAAADWHLVDKAIDHALSDLRSDKPSLAACQASLTTLLATIDKLAIDKLKGAK
jgi:hypothetical protein